MSPRRRGAHLWTHTYRGSGAANRRGSNVSPPLLTFRARSWGAVAESFLRTLNVNNSLLQHLAKLGELVVLVLCGQGGFEQALGLCVEHVDLQGHAGVAFGFGMPAGFRQEFRELA